MVAVIHPQALSEVSSFTLPVKWHNRRQGLVVVLAGTVLTLVSAILGGFAVPDCCKISRCWL